MAACTGICVNLCSLFENIMAQAVWNTEHVLSRLRVVQ